MHAHTLVIREDEAHAVYASFHDHSGQYRTIPMIVTSPEHARRVQQVINGTPATGNWPATLAAIQARGPRCEYCGSWTFRPFLLAVPRPLRFCSDCVRGAQRVQR